MMAVVALLLALFVARPGAQRLKARIVRSMSLALGRQVDVGSVSLRFLPPGFDLENLVIRDDPGFSAEPLLRSQDVTAALRLSSLFRGRLEVSHLILTEPSLNLVRKPEGHWNIENLVLRAAQVPVAPTAKSRTESRPAFPYIEAVRGRINIKVGTEKKPYALTDAEFAIWQASENAWGIRLRAQPMRTDLNPTDTGILQVNGSWQRAASLREMPLQFTLQWDQAQLGQVTKLAYGNDKGWRGSLSLSSTLSGSPENLMVNADAAILDFRRYDIADGSPVRLTGRCSAHYSSVDHELSKLECQAPVGSALISVNGKIAGQFNDPSYDLVLIARNVPMHSVVELARHAKKNIPADLVTAGTMDAEIKVSREAGWRAIWQGEGGTRGFRMRSKLAKSDLILDRIPFAISPTQDTKEVAKEQRSRPRPVHSKLRPETAPSQAFLDIGPVTLAMGASSPVTLRAMLAPSGYNVSIHGDAQIQRLLHAADTLGSPGSSFTADGLARLDLQLEGEWSGFIAPKTTGTVRLQSVRSELRGLNSPVVISSADLHLTQDDIKVQNIAAIVADSSWSGSVLLPRHCTEPVTCPVRFNLHAEEIATDSLNELLSPHFRKQPWYHFLSSSEQAASPVLARLHATGRLSANRLVIHKLVVSSFSANAELENGKLRLADLRADLLGGKQIGEWNADFTSKPPQYSGTGTLQGISLGKLADFMQDSWITGTATATYHVTLAGLSSEEILSSATASLQLDARDGSLPHIALASASPLRMERFVGRLLLDEGRIKIQEGKLETPGNIYQVNGTASVGRILNLKLTRDGASGFSVTGTVSEPHIVLASPAETQAALKP